MWIHCARACDAVFSECWSILRPRWHLKRMRYRSAQAQLIFLLCVNQVVIDMSQTWSRPSPSTNLSNVESCFCQAAAALTQLSY